MASPGLLLLLMSSFLFLSIVSVSASPDQNQVEEVTQKKLNKAKEGAKAFAKYFVNTIDQIRLATTPFLGLINPAVPLVSAIFTLATVAVSLINNSQKDNPILDALQYEFQSLNSKLDKYHVEQKWDTWAAGAYHKPEKNIDVAWNTYEKLVPSLFRRKNYNERERIKQEIIKVCSKSQPATQTLLKYLTVEGPTLTNNLAKDLAAHVKCHEKDLREYTVFISKLIYKGSTLNLLYYKLKQIESKELVDGEADIAYNSASAMFQIHKNCILNSFTYIKPEVEELITNSKKRQPLATEVRSFLVQNYGRYDWMVVAFITQRSKHKIIETLNSHVLTGFTEIKKGKVSVGVARQVKGTHTKASRVKQAIISCFTKPVLCYKVAKKLRECGGSVDGIPVSQTYTAVHAFLRKAHDSHDAKEVEDEVSADPQDTSSSPPYIYTGKCEKSPGVKGGKFVVMIKSDEEMMTKDPCSKLKCGGDRRGKCVRVEDTFVAMCECKLPYYGQNCEQSLEDYKKSLQSSIEQVFKPAVVDKRLRNQSVRRAGI